jgi:hypothetical protein
LNANSDGDRRTPTGAGCNTLVDSIWGRWDAIIPPAFPLYFYEYSDGMSNAPFGRWPPSEASRLQP